MKVNEESQKEETNTIAQVNEEALTDLPIREEQADDTKGGEGHEKWIEVHSFQLNPAGSVR